MSKFFDDTMQGLLEAVAIEGGHMNNILAAKVLISHLPEITDGAYKTATEIAIEALLMDAMFDWHTSKTDLSATEYLGITDEQYDYWIMGNRDTQVNNDFPLAIDIDKELKKYKETLEWMSQAGLLM